MGETYLTIAETATLLRVSRKTLGRLTRAGALPVIKFGGRVLYASSDIDDFIRSHRRTANEFT